MVSSQLLESGFFVDLLQGTHFELVVVDAGLFLGVEHSLREGIIGHPFVSFVGAQGQLNRFHEPNIDHVFQFDLLHEVADHLGHICLHQSIYI